MANSQDVLQPVQPAGAIRTHDSGCDEAFADGALEHFLSLCALPALVTDQHDTFIAVNAPAFHWIGAPLQEIIGSRREDHLRVPGLESAGIVANPDIDLRQGLRGRLITWSDDEAQRLVQVTLKISRYQRGEATYLIWIVQPLPSSADLGADAFGGLQANLLDELSFAVLLVDSDGRPFFRNKKWIRWLEDIEIDAAMLRELSGGEVGLQPTGNHLELAASKTIQEAIGTGNYDQWIEFLVDGCGVDHWFEANLRPIAWEGEIFFCVEIADCTRRHEAQDELRHSEQRFRDLAEISSDWIWETDAELRLNYISDRFYAITGIAPEEILGKTRLELIPDEMRESALWTEHWASVLAHQPFRNFQYAMKMHNGEKANLSLSGKPMFDDTGGFLGYRGVGAEITKLIEAEESKRIFDQRVAHAQRLEALGTLAGGIAHDINNALLPVINMSKMVAKRLPEGSADREKLDIVMEAANHCKVLVRSILSFSRQQEVTKEACDMTAVLRDAVGMLRSTIPSIIGLETYLPSRPIRMAADGSQIKQLLINLTKNAADAIGMQPGRIRIDCSLTKDEAVRERLPIPLDNDTYLLRLSVTDNGQGMDDATKQRVFEPFFTTKPPGEGTGLGLAIVHSVVKSHDGVVDVESRVGEGTSFTIHLPLGTLPQEMEL